jgi:hypothetical protein
VVWQFLLEILPHMGFPNGWLNWISVILSSTSTWVLLNGSPGGRICHVRGLWQGDPLSPMLFLLVMEINNALIRKVDEWSLLHQHVDDLMLFI